MSMQIVRLGDHIELQTGYPFKSAQFTNDPQDIRLLRGDNVAQKHLRWEKAKYWPKENINEYQNYFLKHGDIVLAMDRPWIEAGLKIARVITSDLPALLVQRVSRLRGTNSLDSRFLYYLLIGNSFTQYVLSVQTGTGVPHISAKQIQDYNIPLFPIEIQKRISYILGVLDDKIELNRKMNETLEQMAIALYEHWFVDRADEDGDLVKFSDYVHINPTISLKKGTETKYVEMKVLPVDLMSISDDNIAVKPYTSGSKFQNGDTIFARITPCLENGKTAFVDFLHEGEPAFGSTEFLVFRAKGKLCNPYFVYCMSRSKIFRDYAIKSMVGTSGRQRVQTSSLEEFVFPKPNEELMMKYNDIAKKWFDQIRHNIMESITLKQIRDYLLPRLLSGDIEVQTAEEQTKEVLSRG